jgi:hypothetical protein
MKYHLHERRWFEESQDDDDRRVDVERERGSCRGIRLKERSIASCRRGRSSRQGIMAAPLGLLGRFVVMKAVRVHGGLIRLD